VRETDAGYRDRQTGTWALSVKKEIVNRDGRHGEWMIFRSKSKPDYETSGRRQCS